MTVWALHRKSPQRQIQADAPWPHLVLNNRLYRFEDNATPILLDDVRVWCDENLIGHYETVWAAPKREFDNIYIGFIKPPTVAVPVIVFAEEKDAVLFTLRWGER